MDTVIVTGGAGYIGSHTCKALAAAGFRPVVFDSLELGHADAVKWGPLEVGNILDTDRVAAVLNEYRPAAILHFAAYAYVGESINAPYKYYQNNVAGTVSLLQAMHKAGVGKLVFSSTCATYGVPKHQPIQETQPQQPINPYGWSKLMLEQVLRDAERACGLQSVTLRYFNAAGADPDGEIGEDHEPETHLIPLVIDAALGTRPAISVFGDDYDTPDGTCIRDYIHVSDLADAHVLALHHLLNGRGSAAFNLGNGRGASVREVIDMVGAVLGIPVPFAIHPRRPGDPPTLVGDATRAGQVLGWKPRRSDLESIIRDAAAWRRKPR